MKEKKQIRKQIKDIFKNDRNEVTRRGLKECKNDKVAENSNQKIENVNVRKRSEKYIV